MVAISDMTLSDPSDSDRWYVTNGVVAVGPVAFALLTRGVAHGRIPSGSFIRHETWKVWRRLEDIEPLSEVGRLRTVAELATISSEAEHRASRPDNEAPPPPAAADLELPANDETQGPVSTIRPVAVDPVGVLACAKELDEALLLALSTAVTAASAHVGLLHRIRPDLGGAAVVSCAHGPGAERLLGERLAADDASLLAAQAGSTLMGEPRLGEAGRYIAGRVSRCIGTPRGVAMVPLFLHGQLRAILEVGRQLRPFRAREVARIEDVVIALAERIVVMGWLD